MHKIILTVLIGVSLGVSACVLRPMQDGRGGGDSRHEERRDGDSRHDERHGGDNRHDERHDERHDGRN